MSSDAGSESAPDQTRFVADADVLAADLLVGGSAREAIDVVRSHTWLDLVATEPLLEDAVAIIEAVADSELAVVVEQPPGDHPALAAAYRGNAMHLLSLDETLRSPKTGANLRGALDVSVRSPDAFLAVVDPKVIYELNFEAAYPGPDRVIR